MKMENSEDIYTYSHFIIEEYIDIKDTPIYIKLLEKKNLKKIYLVDLLS